MPKKDFTSSCRAASVAFSTRPSEIKHKVGLYKPMAAFSRWGLWTVGSNWYDVRMIDASPARDDRRWLASFIVPPRDARGKASTAPLQGEAPLAEVMDRLVEGDLSSLLG